MGSLMLDIEKAINMASRENISNTPDYVLARFLMECLVSFEKAIEKREQHSSLRKINKTIKTGNIHINQLYRNSVSLNTYVIKGAFDERFPNNSHAFLMRKDGIGHAYSGNVTKVHNVWDISYQEFSHMAAGHQDMFKLII